MRLLTTLLPHTASPGVTMNQKSSGVKKAATSPGVLSAKISIITVTYNSAATIADTLESVKNQSYNNIEHIIIDGGSSDSTIRIAQSFPHVAKIISEKDNGIYDAMNKGLRMATGDIIGILNSDDVYTHNEVIKNVAEQFEQHNTDTLYGDLQYTDAKNFNKVLRDWNSGLFKKHLFKFGWMPPHPTFFVKRHVYEKVGGFNLALRRSADYELMLRILFKFGFSTSYLPEVMVKMRVGGASNGSITSRLMANREDRMAWKLNELRPYFFTLYLKPLRKVFQYLNAEQLWRIPRLNTAQ